jgi:hypothetical protein
MSLVWRLGSSSAKPLLPKSPLWAFNRLGVRFDAIEEPWAKALALWVGAVFAERIWDGVGT